MYENLATIAVFVFLYSIAHGALARTPINGAIVFAAFGLVFGPLGFGLLNPESGAEGLRTLAEMTLAVVLFTDAANANLGVLRRSFHIPRRLLLIALPLIILLGYGVGVVVLDGLTLLEVAILATLLAPTDAALGKAVVADERVPENIREGLNVESGLNDGICVPILFVFLALATGAEAEGSTSMLAIRLVAEELGIGLVVGVGLTGVGAWLLKGAAERGWVTETWRQLPVVALAIACFTVAQLIGGSGFIAAFVGGLLFGWIAKDHRHRLLLAAEGTGDTLALITWVVFGSLVIGHSINDLSWPVVLYALLSLTVIRMLPVFLALAGLNLKAPEKLFIGWFGPRGLASVVFALIVLDENLPGGGTIAMAATCTIILSIVGHGVSAHPFVAALQARMGRSQGSTTTDKQD